MKKNVPSKRHPLIKEEKTLDFGEDLDVSELTEDQQVEKFISKYMDVVKPVELYSEYFESSAKTLAHILKEVKRYYSRLVIHGTWSEKKYVAALDSIFMSQKYLNVMSLDFAGREYDKQILRETRRRR